MLAIWLGKSLLAGKMSVPVFKKMPVFVILMWIFIFLYFLASVFSVAPVLSVFGWYPRFQGLYTFFYYVIFGMLIFMNLRTEKQLERVIIAIMSSAAFVSLIALLQLASVDFLSFWDVDKFLGRAYGTMAHPDFLGGFLAMIIPVMLARLIHEKNQLLAVTALILSLSALYFSLTRSAYLGLFVGLIFFFLIIFLKKRQWKLFAVTAVIPFLAIAALLMINIFSNNDFIKNQPALKRLVFQEESLRSLQTRFAIWPQVFKQIIDRPFLGYGPETFAVTFPAYAPASLNFWENFTDIADRPHNELLGIAQETGIIGVFVYIAFLVGLSVTVVRKIIYSSGQNWEIILAFSSGILALFITNQFGFSVTVTWLYFFLFVAILLRFLTKKENVLPVNMPVFAKIILFLLIMFSGFTNVFLQDIQSVRADFFYRKGIEYQKMKQYDDARKNFQFARQFAPLQSHYFPNVYNDFEKAAIKAPNYAPIYLEWGKMLLANRKPHEALQMFEKYLSLVPAYYQWKKDLSTRSKDDQEKYRIFYKLHPNFDKVFWYIEKAKLEIGN